MMVVCAALVLSLPAMGLLSALLLERACSIHGGRGPLARVALPLALAVFFESGALDSVLSSLETISSKGLALGGVLSLSSAVGHIFFTAGVTAAVLLLIALAVEFPLRWISSAAKISLTLDYQGIRLLLLVLAVALSWNLIIGLVSAELSPIHLFGIAL